MNIQKIVSGIIFLLFGLAGVLVAYLMQSWGALVLMLAVWSIASLTIWAVGRTRGMSIWTIWLSQLGDMLMVFGVPAWLTLVIGYGAGPASGTVGQLSCLIILIFLALLFFYNLEYNR